MAYTVNVTTGSTGQRSMFMGLDLSNLRAECALGETPVIEKEVALKSKVYTVSELLNNEVGLRFDLILRMMLDEGSVKESDKVKIGSNGRLLEVYVLRTKSSYRIFGKTYYGKTNKGE